MSSRAFSLRSIALAGAGTLLAASLGATLGVYVIAPPVPDSLSSPASVTTATVSSRDFADERSVQMNVTVTPASPVLAPRTGRVTALSLLPGGSIESGSKIMDIDGLPIIALHTSTPLFYMNNLQDIQSTVLVDRETSSSTFYWASLFHCTLLSPPFAFQPSPLPSNPREFSSECSKGDRVTLQGHGQIKTFTDNNVH